MKNRELFYYSGDIGKYGYFQDVTHTCNEINIMDITVPEKIEYDCFIGTQIDCVLRHHTDCYGGDSYWYDSCNTKGDMIWDCGNQGCNNGECINIIPCNGISTQSCTVGTCAGTQSRICNSGTWSDWGTCVKNDANCGTATNSCQFYQQGIYPNCKISTMVYVIGGILLILFMFMAIKKRR